jgi:hypothetical protein
MNDKQCRFCGSWDHQGSSDYQIPLDIRIKLATGRPLQSPEVMSAIVAGIIGTVVTAILGY